MTIQVAGQRVLVIGAGGGIGSATARFFARAGAKVVAAGRPNPVLDAIALEVAGSVAELDILDPGAIDLWFLNQEPFDHVVVAAASTKSGAVGRLPLDDARASMDSKFWGAYCVARSARINDGGSLTFVSGFLSNRPSASAVLQGSINAALDALAKGLALERSPVRVNCVSPGLVNTPLWSGMRDVDREAMFERTKGRLPAKRVGEPDDIAQAIFFVATNPYVTGTTVTVDGGGTVA